MDSRSVDLIHHVPVHRIQILKTTDARPHILTYNHTHDMVFHMKTTLNISDTVMRALKQEAARTGKTMSELVESALRMLLEREPDSRELPPLPTFNMGGARVDISNRELLYDFMEDR